jgi:4'-phosphopantetheinyl transferase
VLRAGEVHLWRGSLAVSGRRLDEFRASLAPEELERAMRFRFEQHRDRFIAGRGYLRSTLSRYVGCDPNELEFRTGPYAKPALIGAQELHFNVAHSEDDLIIAIAQRPLGIDIESKRSIPEIEALAGTVFSEAELACWRRLSLQSRLDNFLGLWTRKEALLKGIGLGITEHLKSVSVFFDEDGTVVVPLSITTEKWMLKTSHESSLVWSLAVPFESAEVLLFSLD